MYTDEQVQAVIATLTRQMAVIFGQELEAAGLEIDLLSDDAPGAATEKILADMYKRAMVKSAELVALFNLDPGLNQNETWQGIYTRLSFDLNTMVETLQKEGTTDYEKLGEVVGKINTIAGVDIPGTGQTVGDATKLGKFFGLVEQSIGHFDLIEAARNRDISKVLTTIIMIPVGMMSDAIDKAATVTGPFGWALKFVVGSVLDFVEEKVEGGLEELLSKAWANEEAAWVIARYTGMYGNGAFDYGDIQAVTQLGGAGADTLNGIAGSKNIISAGGGADWVFGSENDDALGGGSGADELFGNGGNDQLIGGADGDVLDGGAGSDYLEGGAGFDTYRFTAEDLADGRSQDVIVDSDGLGKLMFGAISIGDYSVNNVTRDGLGWETSDRNFRLQVIDGTEGRSLFIRYRPTGASIVIKGWVNGALGITLPNLGQPGTPENPYLLTVNDDILGRDGDKDEATVVSGDDTIVSLGGNDGVDGGYGDDFIDGSHGDDLLLGGPGSNKLRGGLGNDIILNYSVVMDWRRWDDSMVGTGESLEDIHARLNARGDVIAYGNGWFVYNDRGPRSDNAPDHLWGLQIEAWGPNDHKPETDDIFVDLDPNLHKNGDDEILAGEGSDIVHGGEGNDTIEGDIGNDLLVGGRDNDYINGGDDDDLILGDDFTQPGTYFEYIGSRSSSGSNVSGSDVLLGGNGNDRIYGQGGADTLYGGDGDDILSGDRLDEGMPYRFPTSGIGGGDYIDGGAGNDFIYGDDGADTLLGGTGNDTLIGDSILIDPVLHGDDQISGGAGNDTVFGMSGNDLINGGDGDDMLVGDADSSQFPLEHHGNDRIYGGAGNDQLQGGGGNDLLSGDGDQDKLFGEEGDDDLRGGDGQDELVGGTGNDTLDGGSGSDGVWGGDGDDRLRGDSGWDQLYGENGNDSLDGGSGDDRLFGGIGNDRLDGGADKDYLDGEEGDDFLNGGDSDDQLSGGEGRDRLYGGSGKDELAGEAGADILDGGSGDDVVDGGGGDDEVKGGEGNDLLFGNEGADRLGTDAGDDRLAGGNGHDVYAIERGFGRDTIFVPYGNDDLRDVVEFAVDIATADVTYTVSADDLVVGIVGSEDRLTIEDFFAEVGNKVDFRFADGTLITREQLFGLLGVGAPIGGTDGDDLLRGTEGNDNLYGKFGNDRIEALGGNDFVDGGDGDDTIVGGSGDDVLSGGAGKDTYLFEAGFGTDRVDLKNWVYGEDVIRFGDSLSRHDAKGARVGDDLFVRFARADGGTDSVQLQNFFLLGSDRHVIEFADGVRWTSAVWGYEPLWTGTGDADNHTGTQYDDDFDGAGGNDVLYGQAGNDRINGNAGDDYLYGGEGDDLLLGGDGSDVAEGGNGNDRFVNVENIVEYAGQGIDTVVIAGGSNGEYRMADNVENLEATFQGSSVYDIWYRGNGLDNTMTVLSSAHGTVIDGGAGADRMIYLGKGAAFQFSPVTFWIDNVGDTIEVRGDYLDVYVSSTLGGNYAMQAFLDGYSTSTTAVTTITGNTLDNTIDARYAAGGSRLIGGKGNDTFVVSDLSAVAIEELASGGNDTLDYRGSAESVDLRALANIENLKMSGHGIGYGNDAANRLVGNKYGQDLYGFGGDDVLTGNGDSNDHGYGAHRLYGGEGNDTLIDGASWADDVLDGGSGADAMFGGMGSETFHVDNLGDTVSDSGYQSGPIGNADTAHVSVDGYRLLAGSGIETVRLVGQARSFIADEGNDLYLIGNEHDNLFDIRGGKHSASGDVGNDTYRIGRWAGGEVNITDVDATAGNLDRIEFGAGIASTDIVEVTRTPYAVSFVVIDPDGGGRQTVNFDYRPQEGKGIEELVFADGSRMSLQQLLALSNSAPISGESIPWQEAVQGEQYRYTLPADVLYDLDDETLSYTFDRELPSWLSFDAATRTFSGVAPAGDGLPLSFYITVTDRAGLTASTQFSLSVLNAIRGTELGETLSGTADSEVIYGYGGNDVFTGDLFQDRLIGGAGDDTYVLGDASAQVVEDQEGGYDHVQSSEYHELAANVEKLTLTGSAHVDGIGNVLDNSLIGNAGRNRLVGGDGNDILDGGRGTDTLVGGAGNDVYLWNSAYGSDVVDDQGGGADEVRFGLTMDKLLFKRDGDDLLVSADRGTSTAIRVQGHFLGGDSAIEAVSGTGGARLAAAQIETMIAAGFDWSGQGTDVGETISGGGLRDALYGNGGKDTLFGYSGDDRLDGGDGDDYLAGGNGSAANTGNDELIGGAGADTLVGEDGNDRMFGGLGDDKYVYGGGQDIIDNSGGGTDWLMFNSAAYGVERTRLSFHRDGDDLLVRVDADATKQVRVLKHFLGGEYRLAYVQPKSGSAIPASQFTLAPASAGASSASNEYRLEDSLDDAVSFSSGSDGSGRWLAPTIDRMPYDMQMRALVSAMAGFGATDGMDSGLPTSSESVMTVMALTAPL